MSKEDWGDGDSEFLDFEGGKVDVSRLLKEMAKLRRDIALRGEPVANPPECINVACNWCHRSLVGVNCTDVTCEKGGMACGLKPLLKLYAAPISGERAIPAGHCTLFVPHSSACAQQAQCLAVSGERVREALSQNETLIKAVAEELNKHSPMKWEGFVPKHWEPMAQVILHAIDRALPLAAQPEGK